MTDRLTAAHWLVLAALDGPRLPGIHHGSVEGVSVLIHRGGWRMSWALVSALLREMRKIKFVASTPSELAGRALLWTATDSGRAWGRRHARIAIAALSVQSASPMLARDRVLAV